MFLRPLFQIMGVCALWIQPRVIVVYFLKNALFGCGIGVALIWICAQFGPWAGIRGGGVTQHDPALKGIDRWPRLFPSLKTPSFSK